MATVRYVDRNPVVARLCRRPYDWPWSSVAAHVSGVVDELVSMQPMLDRVGDWLAYLSEVNEHKEVNPCIKRHARTGRPMGDESFVSMLETITGKSLAPKKPGRKSKRNSV